MKKLNSSGSAVVYISIALVVVVVIAVIGVITVVLLTRDNEGITDNDAVTNETSNPGNGDSNSQGITSGGDEMNNPGNGDSNSQGITSGGDEMNNPGNGDSNSQGITSGGDYAISNISELLPVCTDNSFPSGIVSTSSGKKTAVFLQPKAGDDYEYSSAATSSLGLSPGYITNEVDLVACLKATGVESFQVPCAIKGTSFELVGYEFDVTVYDLHSKKEVGSSKVSHSRRCPIFAVLRDGKNDASSIDGDILADYINSL